MAGGVARFGGKSKIQRGARKDFLSHLGEFRHYLEEPICLLVVEQNFRKKVSRIGAGFPVYVSDDTTYRFNKY